MEDKFENSHTEEYLMKRNEAYKLAKKLSSDKDEMRKYKRMLMGSPLQRLCRWIKGLFYHVNIDYRSRH